MSDYFASDEYLEYLKKNCGVRGFDFEERTTVCTRPDVDIILRYLKLMDIRPTDRFLEVGCGLGRILKEIHETYKIKPYGIDITGKIIEAAKQRVGMICSDLRVSRAEEIEYEDCFFDKVLCWGTFDLTEQDRTLREMSRVLKVGGLVMITGKNDNYCGEDGEALHAELASRKKGIPNHFTDFQAMARLASNLGLRSIKQCFFERRGDFMNDLCSTKMPQRFYEYLVILRKTKRVDLSQVPESEICSLFSKTYRQMTSIP